MGVFWFENEENAPDMQGTKQNQTNRLAIVPKKLWRSRAKSQTRVSTSNSCSWIPEGNCRWRTESGHRVNLSSSFLLLQSEVERLALQQVALTKLRAMNLGCRIDIPKVDTSALSKTKRRPMLLKHKAKSAGVEGRERKDRDALPERMVFGVPLQQCIQNERSLRHRCSTYSLLNNDDVVSTESDNWKSTDHNFLSVGQSENFHANDRSGSFDLRPSSSEPQIPNIVNSCFRHLEEYGMHTLGLFRVSSSRRRVRQLREDLDTGQIASLNENHHPHDVAQVLKEYFRDLPQPLLTRDLYSAFLATQRQRNESKRLDIFRYLVYLLPVQNRDTLWALLNFLSNVAQNASDTQSTGGDWSNGKQFLLNGKHIENNIYCLTEKMPYHEDVAELHKWQGIHIQRCGNKMDSMNLATLFGPNILHTSKGGKECEYAVDRVYRPEEYSDLIAVVQQLIDNCKKLFVVKPDDLDSAYRRLLVENPEALQVLLKKHYVRHMESQNNENNSTILQELTVESSERNDKNALILPIITISTDNKSDKCKMTLMDNDISSNMLLIPPGHESPSLRRKSFPDHIGASLMPSINHSLIAPLMAISITKDNGTESTLTTTTTSRTEGWNLESTLTEKKEIQVTLASTSQPDKLIEVQKERKYLKTPESKVQIEKSASASSIISGRNQQEKRGQKVNKSSLKSNKNREHISSSPKSHFVIPKYESTERSRSTQRSVTRDNTNATHCQQETWKRWELIASEHSQF